MNEFQKIINYFIDFFEGNKIILQIQHFSL